MDIVSGRPAQLGRGRKPTMPYGKTPWARRMYGSGRSMGPYTYSAPRRPMANYGRIPQGELKFHDTSVVSDTLVATGGSAGLEVNPTAGPVNGVDQGDDADQRIGQQVHMMSLEINGVIEVPAQINQTAADTAPEVAIWVVLDHNANGVECNSEDVLSNPSTSALTSTQPFRNVNFRHRFRILKTWRQALTQPAVVWDGTNIEQAGAHTAFNLNIDLSKLPKQRYKTTAETFAGIETNAINILSAVTNGGVGATISYQARMRYYDN